MAKQRSKTPSEKPAAAVRRPRPAPALAFRRKTNSDSVTHDAIAERAYQLFVISGGQHGRDVEHWLKAEQELRASPAREAVS